MHRRVLLTVSVVAGAVLVLLTVLVAARTGVVLRADAAISRDAVHYVHRHSTVLGLARAVTQLGNPVTVNVVTTVAAIALAWRRRWALTGLVVGTRLVSFGISQALKYGVDRARPHPLDPVAHAGGPSFPSGHSTGIAVLVTLAVLAVWTCWHGAARWATAIVLVVMALAVGASRVLLGVHYLTDVVAGLALGAGVACSGALVLTALTTDAARD